MTSYLEKPLFQPAEFCLFVDYGSGLSFAVGQGRQLEMIHPFDQAGTLNTLLESICRRVL